MLKIRRPLGRLIFNMGIAIPGKTVFLIETAPRGLVKYGMSETHLKLNSRKIPFAHNSCFSWKIILKFCTKHSGITAVLCAKFQTDWIIETDEMNERDFARFKFKMSFGWISYIVHHPRIISCYMLRDIIFHLWYITFISRLRDFTRSYDEMSYQILKRGPDGYNTIFPQLY